MKELTIHHLPAEEDAPPRVRAGYRPRPDAEAEERTVPFSFDLTPEQRRDIQWYLEEFLIYPWGQFRDRAERIEAMLTELGEALFRAVFQDAEIGRLYGRAADDLGQTRLVIRADTPAGIALPWELLRDPLRGENGDLARLAHTFVRSQAERHFEAPAPVEANTFNILMVISRPGGPEGDVPFQSVARPLLELFRPHRDRIRLDILRPPTFEQLTRVLGERPGFYHVLHFDGHGTFPEARDPTRFYGAEGPQGRLAFEGEQGRHRLVTGQELGALVAGKKVPVVLLNACQSGMTHPEALYPSIGNQLLQAGVGGVVAMAYSVYVQTAVRFMARLYDALIDGEELARAVSLAREELRAHPQRTSPIGEIELQDWLVPILFESATFRPVARPAEGLRLNPDILKDEQATAGAEVGCPEPPAFGFVGRDGPILELERAFQTETIVLLEGMAGVGKTETTLGFARWWAETGALTGPIFFFSFEQYLPLAHVYDRVGQTFQQAIKAQLGQEWHLLDAEQRRSVALEVLKQVGCLLIWDNFEPVAGFPKGTPSAWSAQEQQELREFLLALRGGQTKVLLTSRRDEPWLGEIYRRVPLGGLRLAEAQELAVKVLQRKGMNLEQIKALPEYNDLLRYLGGNPLAIQVILPELRHQNPASLLSALQKGEAQLAGDDPAQGRTRSLAASLTYRLDQLDATLRRRLGLLGLFQGFVDADVLAWISKREGAPALIQGIGREEWLGVLTAAAEVGLLRDLEDGYFRAHPALPWFFHALLAESFPEKREWLERAFTAVYGGYGSYLDDLFRSRAEMAIVLLRAEEGNLTWALRLARQQEQWESVGRILYGLRRLWTTQGRWVEWERLLEEIEADVTGGTGEPPPGREELWRALLGHRQELAGYRRDFAQQEAINHRLREHYAAAGDDRNHAVSLHQLGRIAEERRQLEEAERWYRQSLAIKERIGDEHGQAGSLHQLGMIAQERRQFEVAERWYRQSLAINEGIGNEHGQAGSWYQLGRIAYEQGQFEVAGRWFEQSLGIFERIRDEKGQASSLHQLGSIALERRQFEEAEGWYRQSLTINERIGNEHVRAMTLHQLGMIAEERGQFEEAERWYRQSLAICGRIGDEHVQASSLHQLGRLAEERGDAEEAVRFYEQAAALFERLDDPHSLAIVRRSVQRVRGHAPSPAGSGSLLGRVGRWFRRRGSG